MRKRIVAALLTLVATVGTVFVAAEPAAAAGSACSGWYTIINQVYGQTCVYQSSAGTSAVSYMYNVSGGTVFGESYVYLSNGNLVGLCGDWTRGIPSGEWMRCPTSEQFTYSPHYAFTDFYVGGVSLRVYSPSLYGY